MLTLSYLAHVLQVFICIRFLKLPCACAAGDFCIHTFALRGSFPSRLLLETRLSSGILERGPYFQTNWDCPRNCEKLVLDVGHIKNICMAIYVFVFPSWHSGPGFSKTCFFQISWEHSQWVHVVPIVPFSCILGRGVLRLFYELFKLETILVICVGEKVEGSLTKVQFRYIHIYIFNLVFPTWFICVDMFK